MWSPHTSSDDGILPLRSTTTTRWHWYFLPGQQPPLDGTTTRRPGQARRAYRPANYNWTMIKVEIFQEEVEMNSNSSCRLGGQGYPRLLPSPPQYLKFSSKLKLATSQNIAAWQLAAMEPKKNKWHIALYCCWMLVCDPNYWTWHGISMTSALLYRLVQETRLL